MPWQVCRRRSSLVRACLVQGVAGNVVLLPGRDQPIRAVGLEVLLAEPASPPVSIFPVRVTDGSTHRGGGLDCGIHDGHELMVVNRVVTGGRPR